MTALASPASPVTIEAGGIRWSRVDDAFWVANATGSHLGRIELDARGRFHAMSALGFPLGAFATLGAAQEAVEGQRPASSVVRGHRMLVVVTAVAGVAAVGMAIVAVLVTVR